METLQANKFSDFICTAFGLGGGAKLMFGGFSMRKCAITAALPICGNTGAAAATSGENLIGATFGASKSLTIAIGK